MAVLLAGTLAACGQSSPPEATTPSAEMATGTNKSTSTELKTYSYAELPEFLEKNPQFREMLQKAGRLDEELAKAAETRANLTPQQAVPYPIPGCSLVVTAQYDSISKRVFSWGDMTCVKTVTSGYIQLTTGQVSPTTSPTTVKSFTVTGPTTKYTTRPGGVSAPVVAGGTACTQAYAYMNYTDGTYGAGVSPQNACDFRPLVP